MTNGSGRMVLASVLLAALLAPAVHARDSRPAESLRVDAVQAPAWIERQGQRTPLLPGMQLHNRDQLATGAQARVELRLGAGGTLKLGENTRLAINALGRRDAKTATAAFVVDRGTFRFTPAPVRSGTAAGRVNVRIASITAALRQAEVWGSSDGERDLLCLLGGSLSTAHELDTPRDFDAPLSVYRAPHGEAPLNVDYAGSDELAGWLAQTELAEGSGVQRPGGRWQVELATADDEPTALELYDRARAAGFAVRIVPRAGESGSWRYALRSTQLPNRAEAEALAAKLAAALELKATRVLRR